MTASASSLPDLGEGGPAVADRSKIHSSENLRQTVEPAWMSSTDASSSRRGWLRTWWERRRWDSFTSRTYKNGPIRARCLGTLKREQANIQKCKRVKRATSNLCSAPTLVVRVSSYTGQGEAHGSMMRARVCKCVDGSNVKSLSLSPCWS